MTSISNHFAILQSRHLFSITLNLVTPIHIGSTQEDAITSDAPIMRDANKRPFIPGSSIKGIMRTASERLAHLVTDTTICFTEQKKCELDTTTIKAQTEAALYEQIDEKICPVCRTYGGGTIASHVYFKHAYFDKDVTVKTRERASNRIDRETGTAADSALYWYEYIAAGQQLTLTFEAENLSEENLKILGVALLQLRRDLLRIGGLQARGLGQIEFVSGQVTVEDFTSTNKEDALRTLLDFNKPTATTVDIDTFLETIFLP